MYFRNMMQPIEVQEIKTLLSIPKRITIVPHRNPDGDAMGSSLALYHFLKLLNQEVVVVVPNEFPSFLAWLPATDKVLIFESDQEICKEVIKQSDIIFTLDFNALHRVGDIMKPSLEAFDKIFIMIDHHQMPDNFANYTYSDTQYGSTCEMIYHFIHHLEQESYINKTIATCIYTGIVTDSGSFRFPKTSSTTHRIVANLIDIGIENSTIHNQLFDTSSYSKLQLLGRALQNMKILTDCSTSYITLSQQELDTFNFQKGDTEGIVNYGLSINGINFAAIFIENKTEGIIKISFRSQGLFDVNEFARDYFEGGGHCNAAGGKSNLSLTETVQKFEDIVNKIKKNNNV